MNTAPTVHNGRVVRTRISGTCTVMIWRSWVRTPVGSNFGNVVLLSKSYLNPKVSKMWVTLHLMTVSKQSSLLTDHFRSRKAHFHCNSPVLRDHVFFNQSIEQSLKTGLTILFHTDIIISTALCPENQMQLRTGLNRICLHSVFCYTFYFISFVCFVNIQGDWLKKLSSRWRDVYVMWDDISVKLSYKMHPLLPR